MSDVKTMTIISGKGGTGKTSVSASFAVLAKPVVVADCDVDAANLHLLLAPETVETHQFFAMPSAKIDQDLCTQCGECLDLCRFGAIESPGPDNEPYYIEQLSCEGCLVCYEFCPANAIEKVERPAGEWYVSEARTGPMAHARLGIAQENSGKLVTEVRKAASQLAEKEGLHTVIVDGPPGTGCAVIASMTGSDLVVAVAEATLSGMSDLERVHGLAKHFNIPLALVINKCDLLIEVTEKMEKWAEENDVELLGMVPYDTAFSATMAEGKTMVEVQKLSEAGEALVKIWERVQAILDSKRKGHKKDAASA